MAEVFAPFIINRTMHNLTFYCMHARNFVRTKSSLTRKRVLRSPEFERTRYNAGLMGKASKIGSFVYNALPHYWRQGWMYRSFTGEAYTMLKAGKNEQEIRQVLLQRYVELVVNKRPAKEAIAALPVQHKRTYRKQHTAYWKNKTIKSARRKAHKQKLLYNAGLLARASKLGSQLYAHVNSQYKSRSYYQQLTAWAMELLRDEWDEADILAELLPALTDKHTETDQQPATRANTGLITHSNGRYYFISPLYKRLKLEAGQLLLRYSASVASHPADFTGIPTMVGTCTAGSLPGTKKAPLFGGAFLFLPINT